MNTFWKAVGISAIVGVIALAGAGLALAQTATPLVPWTPAGMMGGWGGPMMGGYTWGGPQNSLVSVAAEKLGLTQPELVTELQAGQTIAQIAEAKGVALQTIVDAFLAPRQQALQAAVQAGRLTQAQADAMLAQMRARVQTRLTTAFTPGAGYGPGGYGPGFVDQDGDGICDHMENGSGLGPRGSSFGPMGRWAGR